MNMATLKKLVTTAALTGILAGLLLTLIQQVRVVPLILEAERYEQATATAPHESRVNAGDEHGAWRPENGLARGLSTAAANVILALGFALLLGAAVALRGARLDWRSGLLWGLGGYVAFFLAPSLGLPPQLPGTPAAALGLRQTWWAFASISTAAGLASIFFSRGRTAKALGAVLLIAPHLVGAPKPEVAGDAAPAERAQAFLVATFITNAVFWLALGGLYGFFHRRLAD